MTNIEPQPPQMAYAYAETGDIFPCVSEPKDDGWIHNNAAFGSVHIGRRGMVTVTIAKFSNPVDLVYVTEIRKHDEIVTSKKVLHIDPSATDLNFSYQVGPDSRLYILARREHHPLTFVVANNPLQELMNYFSP